MPVRLPFLLCCAAGAGRDPGVVILAWARLPACSLILLLPLIARHCLQELSIVLHQLEGWPPVICALPALQRLNLFSALAVLHTQRAELGDQNALQQVRAWAALLACTGLPGSAHPASPLIVVASRLPACSALGWTSPPMP